MNHFTHLSQCSKVVASHTVQERISWLQNSPVFPLKPLYAVHEGIRKIIQAKTAMYTKPLTLLMAPSGMGTSTMLSHLKQRLPSHFCKSTCTQVHPLILGHLPVDGGVSDLCSEFCNDVAAPTSGAAAVASKVPLCLNLLQKTGVQMIIIDDCSAFATMSPSSRNSAFNLVRHTISRFGIKVLLNITPNVLPIIERDEQLWSRAQTIEIVPFKVSEKGFEHFLRCYSEWCPLQRESDLLNDKSLQRALLRRTGGITRNMMDVLTRLSISAIISGDERITYQLFRSYFNQATYAHG